MKKRVKIYRTIVDNRNQNTKKSESYQSTDYIEVRFWGGKYDNCTWVDCRFTRSSFSNGMSLNGCNFIKCIFATAHTSLNANFKKCLFEDCIFKATSFSGAFFEECKISGAMHDVVFYGREAEPMMRTRLIKVDMSRVSFNMTDFQKKVDLETTIFGYDCGTLLIEGKPICE